MQYPIYMNIGYFGYGGRLPDGLPCILMATNPKRRAPSSIFTAHKQNIRTIGITLKCKRHFAVQLDFPGLQILGLVDHEYT